MNWCWLIGHDAKGPVLEPVVDGVTYYVYTCGRCGILMIFDSDLRRWVKWSE